MTTVLGILGAAGIAPSAVLRPAARRDDGYDALLADPDVDLVDNALPPSLHARWTIAALEAGKHVLCEKSFTLDAAQADQVVAATSSPPSSTP